MSLVEHVYKMKENTPSDINDHLKTLKRYSEECETVVEMGVRSIVSTWGFINGLKKNKGKLLCIDIENPSKFNASPTLEETIKIAEKENVLVNFIIADTLTYDMQEADMLFIDTLHNYDQLIVELIRHSPNVKKYIILHDTEHNKIIGDYGKEGLEKAINEFLQLKTWKIKEVFTNNNGLTVLERIGG